MKAETELGGLEFLFLLNVFGAFVALGLAVSEYVIGVAGAGGPISTDGYYLPLAGVIFAIGLSVTSVLLFHDPREKRFENDVLMHAGQWTEAGGIGITHDPVIVMGVLWTLGGLAALGVTISRLFA